MWFLLTDAPTLRLSFDPSPQTWFIPISHGESVLNLPLKRVCEEIQKTNVPLMTTKLVYFNTNRQPVIGQYIELCVSNRKQVKYYIPRLNCHPFINLYSIDNTGNIFNSLHCYTSVIHWLATCNIKDNLVQTFGAQNFPMQLLYWNSLVCTTNTL